MAYIYQADLWCDDCTHTLLNTLPKPEDPENESSFDSDHYPKYAGDDGGESDCPEHCGGCRCPLGNPLTDHGVTHVLDSIHESLEEAVTKGRTAAWDFLCSEANNYPKDNYFHGSRHVEILRGWAEQLSDYNLERDEKALVDLFLELSAKP